MFTNLDLSLIQKKLLENPKISLGAAGVAAIALIYALGKSADDDLSDMNVLPDFAKSDVDYEFTQRFNNKNKHRNRSPSNHIHRGKRPHAPNHDDPPKQEDLESKEEEAPKYSLLDPNNPNYSYDMNRDEETDESEQEEGFSVDEYYVPFRVHNAKTKRKPDAPFMAMFTMYANKQKSTELIEENMIHRSSDSDILNEMNDHKHVEEQEVNREQDEIKEEKKGNDDDVGSSPPLNPHIPSHNLNDIQPIRNSLDTLRERYYRKELPQSLQPDVLSNAFSSKRQQAIQNKLDADDSLLGGIKQSVQMITQSND